jgi:2-dehydro-3-deoxygluconokinase
VELVKVMLVVFGEGMVEERGDGAVAWGGDVVNTAVYLARQGATPELMSAMGVDAESATILAAWAAEGIGVGHVLRDPARSVGRYRISVDDAGQRSFVYDRARSAARGFFDHSEATRTFAWAAKADVLYLTGVTLSIFGRDGRERIGALARRVRGRGGQVVFDTNYRAAGWASPEAAWAAMSALGPAISLAMPSLEDQMALTGAATPEAAAEAWRGLGADEVVVKLGADGAYVESASGSELVPAVAPPQVLDTTAAGDAFNAGYIAARLAGGASMREAAERGAALAAEVIGWPGAIAPLPVGLRAVETEA